MRLGHNRNRTSIAAGVARPTQWTAVASAHSRMFLFAPSTYTRRQDCWANYHRHVVSKRTFVRVDHEMFSSLWRWARRRHPNKNAGWRKQKHFALHRGRDWPFFGKTCDDEGQPSQVCATPVAHPSSDTLKSKVTRTPTTLPMNPTSNHAKEPICRIRFGLLVRFAFSGMNSAGSALCAIQKSLGSRVGVCTTAFPV